MAWRGLGGAIQRIRRRFRAAGRGLPAVLPCLLPAGRALVLTVRRLTLGQVGWWSRSTVAREAQIPAAAAAV